MRGRPTDILDRLDRFVVRLLEELRDTGAPGSSLLRDLFRDMKLKPREQKRVRDVFYMTLSKQSLVMKALEVATPGGSVAPALEIPLCILVARVIDGDLSPKAAHRILDWVDWPRVAQLEQEALALEDSVERISAIASLPPWLAKAMAEQYGETDATDLASALTGRPPVTLRANTLRGDREALIAALAAESIESRPTSIAEHGVTVTSPAQIFRTEAFRDGLFEMQDEASQLVAELTAPPPRGLVLDVCAGAGGKALALAAALDGRGEVVALDTDAHRLADLKRRAKRAGAHNLRAIRVPHDHWPDDVIALAQRADRILVDAPCSGVGSLRRHPDMRQRFSRDESERLRRIQLELTQRAASHLAPHARLIYATCTVLRAENEDVIAELREAHPTLEPVSIIEILGGERGRPVAAGDPLGTFMQALPHRHGTDGFFAAVLRRPRG